MNKHPSTTAWIVIHIACPMIPFVLGGLIRIAMNKWHLSFTTFSASELAICLALLVLFINQSLLKSQRILDNEDKETDVEGQAALFLLFAIILIALFVVIVVLHTAVYDCKMATLCPSLNFFTILVFVMMPLIVWWSIMTQKSFRLKTSI